ncbi:MAG: alpha-amylase family glycosyl hydrolase [Roseburia sp.]|nr:alpha-amylase family glycosyl hydrolase [Roseburia sp.]MCM1279124.1 alpha-amylase family glycosyl hydrolase [Robinsoniella sp.]
MRRRKGIKAFSLFMALVLVFTTGIWTQALETQAVFEEPDALTDNIEEAPEQSGAEEEPQVPYEVEENKESEEYDGAEVSEEADNLTKQEEVEGTDLSEVRAIAKTGSAELRDKVFSWDNATVYFVLTDRFLNADRSNDHSYGRGMKADGSTMLDGLNTYTSPATWHGGDLKGLTQKVEEGYFNDLGVNAIWITAPYEQIHGYTSANVRSNNASDYPDPQKQGFPYYSYHGYWALDFSQIDANMGSEQDFADFVDSCHEHGIRVVMDIVMNHVGYTTMQDAVDYGFDGVLKGNWRDYYYGNSTFLMGGDPESTNFWEQQSDIWRTKWWGPGFVRASYPGYTAAGGDDFHMSLSGLPDVITEEGASEVPTPPLLVTKWTQEGRLSKEQGDLDAFFQRTGYPKKPRYYIIKWLTDWVREYGVDGFRCDTAKHVDLDAWNDLKTEADKALKEWRSNNPGKAGSSWTDDFWMTGECWGHGQGKSPYFTYGGFDSMINFTFNKSGDPTKMEGTYSSYAADINSDPDYNVLSYISSHDDSDTTMGVWKATDDKSMDLGTCLLLSPGGVQIYYGNEINRGLEWENFLNGNDYLDQRFRSDMDWNSVTGSKASVLKHWQKVGQFRNNHLSVGAGQHEKLSDSPYAFSRTYHLEEEDEDKVVVALPDKAGTFTIPVGSVFEDGETITDAYSGNTYEVSNGSVSVTCDNNGVILLQGSGIVKASVNAKTKNNATTYSTDTFDITLRANKAENTYYSINGGTKVPFENNQVLTIGGDTAYEEETTLTLTGISTDDNSTLTKTIVYKRGPEPAVRDDMFYIKVKKSDFSSPPNIYVYSQSEPPDMPAGTWPGSAMTEDEDPEYYSYINEDVTTEMRVIFTQGSWRSTPEGATGLAAKGYMLYDKSANTLTELPSGAPGRVTINYKKENGEVIKSIYRVGIVGKTYQTYPAVISGYTLKTTPTNASGTIAENVTVDYIYSDGGTPVGNDINITGFAANPVSGSAYRGSVVNLAVAATGGTGTLQYKFTAKLENGSETTIQDYRTGNTVTWTPQAAGKYTLKVYVKDSGSKSAEKTITNYEVKEASPNPTELSISFADGTPSYVYDGNEKKPAVIVKDGTKTLVEGTDYSLSYYDCINAGSKDSQNAPRVIVAGKGSYAAKIVNVKLTFTIEKAEIPKGAPESSMTAAAGVVADLTLNAGWEWSADSKNIELHVGETVSVSAVYNGDDKANYKTTSVSISLTGISCDHPVSERETIMAVAPTCTSPGRNDIICKKCHKTIEAGSVIRALGHEGGTATCTSQAVCGRCGEAYGFYDNTNHANVVVQNKREASCQQAGYTGDTICEDCGTIISQGKPVAKTDHKWDGGKVTKAPTETADGVRTYTCTVCKTATRTETIPKTQQGGGLQKGDSVIDASSKAVYKVTRADSTVKQVEFILSSDSGKTVNIPSTIVIKGITYQVTSIADSALKNNKTVETVKVGSNVKTIGEGAFSGCSKLKKVTLSNSTTQIGDEAFYKCTKLTSITIPSKVSKVGSKAFYGCKKLKKITIKTTKLTSKKVGSQAFKGIAAKATIKVPKKKLSAYKKLLKQKGVSSKAKIKK